jgi:hypothetical protein
MRALPGGLVELDLAEAKVGNAATKLLADRLRESSMGCTRSISSPTSSQMQLPWRWVTRSRSTRRSPPSTSGARWEGGLQLHRGGVGRGCGGFPRCVGCGNQLLSQPVLLLLLPLSLPAGGRAGGWAGGEMSGSARAQPCPMPSSLPSRPPSSLPSLLLPPLAYQVQPGER